MKTLSRTFWLVVLGAIVTLVVVGCYTFPYVPGIASYCLEIGSQPNPPSLGEIYVKWKTKHDFDEALKQVCDHGGIYCIKAKLDDGTVHDPYQPSDPPSNCTNCRGYLRTVKVTKSKVADGSRAAESAINDPHATYRIQSPYPSDIVKVLNALEK